MTGPKHTEAWNIRPDSFQDVHLNCYSLTGGAGAGVRGIRFQVVKISVASFVLCRLYWIIWYLCSRWLELLTCVTGAYPTQGKTISHLHVYCVPTVRPRNTIRREERGERRVERTWPSLTASLPWVRYPLLSLPGPTCPPPSHSG